MKNSVKRMLSSFFDNDGIIDQKFALQEQTFNQGCYISMLKRLREDERQKRPQKWAAQDWVIHNDDATVHIPLSVQHFFGQNRDDH